MYLEPSFILSVAHFLITIDVEDWFQVENLRPWNPISTWDSRELRVEANVHELLDLFDDIKLEARSWMLEAKNNPTPCTVHRMPSPDLPQSSLPQASNLRPQAVKKVRCTFFTLGWIAERLPKLVREIVARGHEVASHGSRHRTCSGLTASDLRSELVDSKHLLEDITAKEVSGFRAPNFSVDDRVLSLLQESGYRYDSSFNSFSFHGRYGRISLNGNRAGIAHRIAENFFELPVSNLNLEKPNGARCTVHGAWRGTRWVLPWSGGAYFRLMPLSMFTMGVRFILKKQGAYIFYMHPWEIDPDQPQVHSASVNCRFRHYTNLKKTYQRLKGLIASFDNCSFVTCHEYVKEVT